MLTQRNIFGRIEVLTDGQIQLREDKVFEDNGVEVARTYRRRVLEPSATHNETDPRLVSIIAAVWTAEIIDAYKQEKQRRLDEISSVSSEN